MSEPRTEAGRTLVDDEEPVLVREEFSGYNGEWPEANRYQNERRAALIGRVLEIERQAATLALADVAEKIEAAWGIIANAGNGDWTKETPEWQEAAARWRDAVMPDLSARLAATKPEATLPGGQS